MDGWMDGRADRQTDRQIFCKRKQNGTDLTMCCGWENISVLEYIKTTILEECDISP